MANTFRSASKASIGTSEESIYQVSLTGGQTTKTAILLGVSIANRNANAITASVRLDRPAATIAGITTDDAYLIKDVPIPAGSTVEIMAGQKIILSYDSGTSTGDILKASCNTASSMDVIASFLEIT